MKGSRERAVLMVNRFLSCKSGFRLFIKPYPVTIIIYECFVVNHRQRVWRGFFGRLVGFVWYGSAPVSVELPGFGTECR